MSIKLKRKLDNIPVLNSDGSVSYKGVRWINPEEAGAGNVNITLPNLDVVETPQQASNRQRKQLVSLVENQPYVIDDLAEKLGITKELDTKRVLRRIPDAIKNDKPLESVSPEFYALMGVRGLANVGLKTAGNYITQTLKPGSSFWTNPITKQMFTSEFGLQGANAITAKTTPYRSWAEGISDATGMPEWVTEFTNPGIYLSPTAIEKTAVNLGKGINKFNRIYNSPLTGNWTQIGNYNVRFAPNVAGSNNIFGILTSKIFGHPVILFLSELSQKDATNLYKSLGLSSNKVAKSGSLVNALEEITGYGGEALANFLKLKHADLKVANALRFIPKVVDDYKLPPLLRNPDTETYSNIGNSWQLITWKTPKYPDWYKGENYGEVFNPPLNPAELAAAKDFYGLQSIIPKLRLQNTGRPIGDYLYPKEVRNRLGITVEEPVEQLTKNLITVNGVLSKPVYTNVDGKVVREGNISDSQIPISERKGRNYRTWRENKKFGINKSTNGKITSTDKIDEALNNNLKLDLRVFNMGPAEKLRLLEEMRYDKTFKNAVGTQRVQWALTASKAKRTNPNKQQLMNTQREVLEMYKIYKERGLPSLYRYLEKLKK